MSETIRIQTVSWSESREDLLRVRNAVFVVEQGVPESIEVDEHDAESIHFLAILDDSSPIGTARLLPSGKVGRVAVLEEFRRRGVGGMLMKAAIGHWQKGPCREMPLRLHAQTWSIPFYETLGFVAIGPEFEEADIPHRQMILEPSREK